MEGRQERDRSKESQPDPHTTPQPSSLKFLPLPLATSRQSPPPSAHHNQNTTKSQFSPRFQRGLGSLDWVLFAQCWTCRPACIACYCSSSRTIAVGREDFRGSTTRKRDRRQICLPTPCNLSHSASSHLRMGQKPYLRDVLLNDSQGSRHAASTIQDNINVLGHQIFRKKRGVRALA